MLWKEIFRKKNVSLLESLTDTQYCVCHDYDPSAPENTQYYSGNYFCYFSDKSNKAKCLTGALDLFRSMTEENYISMARMTEIAKYIGEGLMQDDYEQALIYLNNELTEEEMCKLGFEVGK